MFECEKYLKFIKDKYVRSELCKLCISAHNLMVERGRYIRPKPDISKRVCIFCKDLVDTEYHFIFECLCNVQERDILFQKVLDIYPQFKDIPERLQFIKLIECSNYDITILFAKFVVCSVNRRKAIDWAHAPIVFIVNIIHLHFNHCVFITLS